MSLRASAEDYVAKLPVEDSCQNYVAHCVALYHSSLFEVGKFGLEKDPGRMLHCACLSGLVYAHSRCLSPALNVE